MGELLIKPYEISVWEDKLTQNGFEEVKLAVIGSNTMEGPNKVYDPVFNKKSNGEKSLTFSLKYKYFDPYSGNSEVINPFAALLVNERKVKLHYDGKWYEFIVKDHTESSDEFTWTYTCNDAFVIELAKNGYNITFDAELNNNQGTAFELAQKTIQDTDWKMGTAEIGPQLVEEPIYKAKVVSGFSALNTDTQQVEDFETEEELFIFYSYIKNKNGKNLQFIRQANNYKTDDKNVIIATNYRITNEVIVTDTDIKINNITKIIITGAETFYQAYRLAYNQLTTYDPVMGRTVERFQIIEDGQPGREVYKYTDYTYTTSNVVLNYITNGENFNALEDGTLQGWNPYVEFYPHAEKDKIVKLELKTIPELGSGKELADIARLAQIEGFLKANFKGPRILNNGEYKNLIYNSGFENNASLIESISNGQKFVFRWRANKGVAQPSYKKTTDTTINPQNPKTYYTRTGNGSTTNPYVYTVVATPTADKLNEYYEQYTDYVINGLHPATGLRAMVARYTQDEATKYGYYYKHIDPDDVIIDFKLESGQVGNDNILNNYIDGGELKNVYELTSDTEINNNKTYYVNIASEGEEPEYGVVQNPDVTGLDHYYELHQNYVIDDVPQTPSTKYIYRVGAQEYTYNAETGEFISGTENYLPYYYLIGEAEKAIAQKELRNLDDDKKKIGVFIYTIDNGENYYFIQDIQITKYVEDGKGKPVILGNIPTAISTPVSYYYLKPEEDDTAEEVDSYKEISNLLQDLNLSNASVVPLYNEKSDKILSISESHSNCFNILQSIAETFECWIDLVVEHDARGDIRRDNNGNLEKYVYLREYVGKDNFAGFKYAINLQSIERNINSDEIVTKMIVEQSQSDYVDEGFISIANAPSNPSGESYIINFDYYYNQGLLDRKTTEAKKLEFIESVKKKNQDLQDKQKERREHEASLTNLESKRNVYGELLDSARDAQTQALSDFYYLTKKDYEDYRKDHTILPEIDQLTEAETVLDTLSTLYVSSATINNYSGIYTNIDQEYWNIRKELKGSENYKVKLWVASDEYGQRHVFIDVSDYLLELSFYFNNGDPNDPYECSLSKKYFDIETDATVITFTAPDGYYFSTEDDSKPTTLSLTINDNKTERFRVICDDTIEGIEDEIEKLQNEKEELVKEFNNIYLRYIQEGTWNSTDYIDSELYYLDALQVSNTSAQPTASYTINVVEISEIEGFEWYLFDAGDKTYVEDTEFFGWENKNVGTEKNPVYILTPAREEVIVSEVEWHLDSPDENVITVQNYKTRFEDLFQRISATVQTVQYNEATYAKISSLLDANGTINQNVLLESLNNISGKNYNLTSDGSILIDGDNILVRNLTNSANLVKINSEGIRISSDGGTTWTTAIDGQGINIGTVYTGKLNTNQVVIGNDENPSFRWDKAGISAYKSINDEAYDLQTFVRYDQYGLYGIKDNGSFTANSLDDVLDKAHFAVTWDGFFIKNSYTGGGKVQITSDNDFQVINANQSEKIKIGALEWTQGGVVTTTPIPGVAPSLYGIRINNNAGETVMKTGDDGNLTITGAINATEGHIGGLDVYRDWMKMKYIVFEPEVGIYSTYPNEKQPTRSRGANTISAYPFWISDEDGSAIFNNITVRGSIKTSVFEYEEIQAVGGAFMFRPSTAIKMASAADNVVYDENTGHYSGDLIITVEKPLIVRDGAWYKLSSYNSDTTVTADTLSTYGLVHIYQLQKVKVNNQDEIRLIGAAAILDTVNINDIAGGSVIDMGFESNTYRPISLIPESNPMLLHLYELSNGTYILTEDQTVVQDKTYYKECYQEGINNYGIGINSSDNYINLPPRAISLFETVVDHTQNPKVSYRYRGILGTLPDERLNNLDVRSSIYPYMRNTQGIYTDNMYIGDADQYIAFYTDTNDLDEHNEPKKKLKISAREMVFEYDPNTGEEITWEDKINDASQGADGEDAITVNIDSSAGTVFLNKNITTTLTCTVIKGNGTDITNQVTRFTWSKKNADGTRDTSWSRPLAGNTITLTEADVTSKAIFTCEVEF